jgi:hypothetical protein
MKNAFLTIKCWQCGREETIAQILVDNVVDINLDKLCPFCTSGWMVKKALTIEKLT